MTDRGIRFAPAFELFQQAWPDAPHLTLCDRQARKGIAVVAVDGECPVHGGDGCLYEYVQVADARRRVAALETPPRVRDRDVR